VIGGNLEANEKPCAPKLSIEDNLIIHAHRRALRTHHIMNNHLNIINRKFLAEWTKKILAASNINERLNENAESFSGGQLQRMLLWREFNEDALFLMFSEVTSAIDYAGKQNLFEKLKEMAGLGKAVLASFSDTDDLLEICDNVIVLYNGKLILNLPLFEYKSELQKNNSLHEELKNKINLSMTGSV
jgi:ABC-type uncharacterized transport system ATPase subunit